MSGRPSRFQLPASGAGSVMRLPRMALAGPVAELIGLRTTFYVAGLVPMVIAVVAIVWARLPQDELAHPLR